MCNDVSYRAFCRAWTESLPTPLRLLLLYVFLVFCRETTPLTVAEIPASAREITGTATAPRKEMCVLYHAAGRTAVLPPPVVAVVVVVLVLVVAIVVVGGVVV